MRRINFISPVALVLSTAALLWVFVNHSSEQIHHVLIWFLGIGYACTLIFVGVRMRYHMTLQRISMYPILVTLLNILFLAILVHTGEPDFFWTASVWGWFLGLLYCAKRNMECNDFPLAQVKAKHKAVLATVASVVVLICAISMEAPTKWVEAGKMPMTDSLPDMDVEVSLPSYIALADSIISGRLDAKLPVDPLLLSMENPYDPYERGRLGVKYFWDFAFFNNKYYVYFGPVPVLLTMVPYQLITGQQLPICVTTQVFIAFAIIGMFVLLYTLSCIFFKEVTFSLYLLCAVVFSFISTSFSIQLGNQYNTAVLSGMCFVIWSLYFLLRAGWQESTTRGQVAYLFLASLFGALVFGCRPPIGLACAAFIPVLARLARTLHASAPLKETVIRFTVALSPFPIVAAALMTYNQARFGNPLDFGAAYNLTLADMRHIQFEWPRALLMLWSYLLHFHGVTGEFPFVVFWGGAFVNYPILLAAFLLCHKGIYQTLDQKECAGFFVSLLTVAFVIVVVDIAAAHCWVHERYRMDFYFLFALAAFAGLCAAQEVASSRVKRAITAATTGLSIASLCMFTLLQHIPFEDNLSETDKGYNTRVWKMLSAQTGHEVRAEPDDAIFFINYLLYKLR